MNISIDDLTNWMNRFWFLRGAVTVFALLSLIEALLGWPKSELLRFVLAVVMSWNSGIELLSDLFSKLPMIPKLSVFVWNYIILTAVFIIPGMLSALSGIARKDRNKWTISKGITGLVFFGGTLFFMQDAATGGDFFRVLFCNEVECSKLENLFIGMLALQAPFWCVVWMLLFGPNQYRRGFLTLVSALSVASLVYFAPLLGDSMKSFADSVLGPTSQSETSTQ